MYVPSQFRVARNTWAIRAISWQVDPPGPVGAHQMRRLYTFTTMINFRMQERCYGVTEERGRGPQHGTRSQSAKIIDARGAGTFVGRGAQALGACPLHRTSPGRGCGSGTRPSLSGFAFSFDWSLGASALWDQLTPNPMFVRKSTLEHYDFNRKDCFRAQTPLNWSDKPATIAGDRRNRYDGMK